LHPVRGHEWIANNIERVNAALESCDGGRDIVSLPDFDRVGVKPELALPPLGPRASPAWHWDFRH